MHRWIVNLMHLFIAYYLSIALFTIVYLLLYTQSTKTVITTKWHLCVCFICTELKTWTFCCCFSSLTSTDLSFRKCKSCYLLFSSLQGSGQNESSNQSLCSVGSLSDKELEVSAHLKLKQLLSHKHLCFCLEWVMQTDVFHVVSQGGPARCSNVVFGVMFYFTQWYHPGRLVGKTLILMFFDFWI